MQAHWSSGGFNFGVLRGMVYSRVAVGPPGATDALVLVINDELDVGDLLKEPNAGSDTAEARTDYYDLQWSSFVDWKVTELEQWWTAIHWGLRRWR